MMKNISITILFIYIWYVFWRFFLQTEAYNNSIGIAFLMTIASLVFLAQALFISYFLVQLSERIILNNIYKYVVVPILFIIFQNILLIKMDIFKPYNDFITWGIELVLLIVFMPSLTKFMGENLLPLLNPDGQRTWTKRLPPTEVKDMRRGFFLLLFILAIPFVLSSLYK